MPHKLAVLMQRLNKLDLMLFPFIQFHRLIQELLDLDKDGFYVLFEVEVEVVYLIHLHLLMVLDRVRHSSQKLYHTSTLHKYHYEK